MTRRWNIPMTYPPKIPKVQDGTCTQSIRFGRKYHVGDEIRYFNWSGRPYRSKWILLTGYMPIIVADPVKIFPNGIQWVREDDIIEWWHCHLDDIAVADGIEPPTGEALRDVLISNNGKIPAEGREAQIIRWEWKP